MGLDNRFCDGQSETRAAIGPAARGIGAPESFEDVRQVRCGNALASVGDRESYHTLVLLNGNTNLAMVFVVVNGVSKKIRNDEGDAVRNTKALRSWQVGVHGDAAFGRKRADQFE